MGLDIEKLKEKQKKIREEAILEMYESLPTPILQAVNNNTLNYCLEEQKSGAKEEHSARVLNNWINTGVLKIQDEDRGKIKRFNKIENIWLNIVVKAREFGMPLDLLKIVRDKILESPIQSFTMLKFGILETILHSPQLLLIFDDGHSSVWSFKSYNKHITKKHFRININFNLIDYIKKEFPKNALDIDFKIIDVYEDINKIKMLYFLRTGDYKYIKLYLSDSDVRIIEDSNILSKNKELMKIICDWKFQKAEIIINDEVETLITP